MLPGLAYSLGIELAIRLGDGFGGIGGEIVPEMIEIDPLAAGDQRQRRLAEEMEMPEIAQQEDVIPFADAGQEGFHQHETIDLGGILRRIGIGDHQPDIVADQANAIVFEVLDQRMNVPRHRRLGVAVRGRRGLTEAAQIGRDHGVLVGEFGDQRPPHVAGFGIAVQQHDRIALAGDEIMQPDAVDLGEFALRGLRQGRVGTEQCER